jgi:uncharacterized glyoxalase superfamily protein PhnB
MKLHTYLNYGGNCEEAFRFYEKNLGGKIKAIMRYGEQPDPKNAPPGTENFVLYINMTIGETELMGERCSAGTFSADAQCVSFAQRQQQGRGGTNLQTVE